MSYREEIDAQVIEHYRQAKRELRAHLTGAAEAEENIQQIEAVLRLHGINPSDIPIEDHVLSPEEAFELLGDAIEMASDDPDPEATTVAVEEDEPVNVDEATVRDWIKLAGPFSAYGMFTELVIDPKAADDWIEHFLKKEIIKQVDQITDHTTDEVEKVYEYQKPQGGGPRVAPRGEPDVLMEVSRGGPVAGAGRDKMPKHVKEALNGVTLKPGVTTVRKGNGHIYFQDPNDSNKFARTCSTPQNHNLEVAQLRRRLKQAGLVV